MIRSFSMASLFLLKGTLSNFRVFLHKQKKWYSFIVGLAIVICKAADKLIFYT